jgi:hypothetical protein
VILHVTNGDSAGGTLKLLFRQDVVLPWRDVLHDGPVPAGLTEGELNEVRARFIAGRGWAVYDDVLADFEKRDQTLAQSWQEIVLWFEHDLYDQLQLLQVLALLRGRTDVTLIQPNDYLGPMPPEKLGALFPARRPVSRDRFETASAAWKAFRAPDPHGLCDFPLFERFCEEYPWAEDGCSRTERFVLRTLAEGPQDPYSLFGQFQDSEEPKWMGDTSFFAVLSGLKAGAEPLLTPQNKVTAKGHAVLKGRADRVRGNGIDRWMGGVHLSGDDTPWRWDPTSKGFRRSTGSAHRA